MKWWGFIWMHVFLCLNNTKDPFPFQPFFLSIYITDKSKSKSDFYTKFFNWWFSFVNLALYESFLQAYCLILSCFIVIFNHYSYPFIISSCFLLDLILVFFSFHFQYLHMVRNWVICLCMHVFLAIQFQAVWS